MSGQLISLLVVAAGMFALGLIPGHKRGRWSCRLDYPRGWDAGVAAERERWEQITGATYERVAAETAEVRVPDVPGPDGWPYGFHVKEEPPATEVLLAQADTALGKPPRPPVPSVAELDQMAARWRAVHEAEKNKPPRMLPDDPEWDISDEEFEAAKRDLIERHGAIPPSLQRVADQGGRFRRLEARLSAACQRGEHQDCGGGRVRGGGICTCGCHRPRDTGHQPPVVTDITDAARPYTAQEIRDGRRMWGVHWGGPGEPGHIRDDPRMAATLTAAILTGDAILRELAEDDVPTLTGVIVSPRKRDRTGPEWLEAQLAAMDSETAAWLRRTEADLASFRRGITTGGTR